LDVHFPYLIIVCFVLLGGTKNPMFLQILCISFSAFKALLGNHFHILKTLFPKKTLLLLMPNKNPNIELGSL
jgi:hypothetical protein